ncbi:hypothetical protein F5X99DRAFT_432113 [Biscogniauxia marginata]|nr:hypothetical protein F5X99DRAFT_432113 [Biscogniauxia marginata]
MCAWGLGLLQSDDDFIIALSLDVMLGCCISSTPKSEAGRQALQHKLNSNGLLASKLDMFLSGTIYPLPPCLYLTPERYFLILAVRAMAAGARLEERHLDALHRLRPTLPTLEQQLQLMAVLDGYKNDGTHWILGSKGLFETISSMVTGRSKYNLGHEFLFSGLG